MGKTRVLLVDDQEIVRQGLATILRYEPGIEVVGQAADGQQAIAQALQLKPDVILMDIKMPRLGGIPATREIKLQLPQAEVIILTTYETDDLVFDGIKAGASGYLLKDVSSEVLVGAIEGVMRGEAQLDPKVASKVLSEFKRLLTEPAPRPKVRPEDEELILTPLTEREEEVLQLLAEGLSNKDIAARLYLTEGTVKNHISNILGKLQANDRTHAVIRALRHGLVEL